MGQLTWRPCEVLVNVADDRLFELAARWGEWSVSGEMW